MGSNLSRFRKDLSALINKSHELQFSMVAFAHSEPEATKLFSDANLREDIVKKAFSGAAQFRGDYEHWYSECIALLRQILPDRVEDFRALYAPSKTRKTIDYLSYTISDAIIGLITRSRGEVIADAKAAIPKFQAQLSILSAAERRFESSLFEIRQLVQADLFDSEIQMARELLKNRFFRAAGAVAGVVLEKHLRQVCSDRNIRIMKKSAGIGDLNEALKSTGVIDIPQWRHISLLADYRNLCDHDKQKEPSGAQVTDLIDGTDKVLRMVV